MSDGSIMMMLIGIALQALPPARAIVIHLRRRSAAPDVAQRTTART